MHTHTHTHIYIYIYTLCVCVYVYTLCEMSQCAVLPQLPFQHPTFPTMNCPRLRWKATAHAPTGHHAPPAPRAPCHMLPGRRENCARWDEAPGNARQHLWMHIPHENHGAGTCTYKQTPKMAQSCRWIMVNIPYVHGESGYGKRKD